MPLDSQTLDGLTRPQGGAQHRLERVTRLAQQIFDVPISSVTLLEGDDRARLTAPQGVEPMSLPREQTFCDTTTRVDRLVVAEDARDDPRFATLDAVCGPMGVVFYAGHPLRDPSGQPLGTLCLFDTRPRSLSEEQLVTFADLAAWAEFELLAAAEMARASAVQTAMLPERSFQAGPWHLDGTCLPALAVGGDFYDYGEEDGVLHLSVGDVMGKGTGAALVGAGVRTALRGAHPAVAAGVDLGVVVTQLTRSLLPDLERAGSFATLFTGALDVVEGTLRYVDAGSGLSLLVRADGSVEHLRSRDRPLGVLPDDHWEERWVRLHPGDRLVLLSDGVLDLLPDPVRWQEPVVAMVREAATSEELVERVSTLAAREVGLDDVTVVAVFHEGPAVAGAAA